VSRIAIFSPDPLSAISGNNTTLRRLARGLRGLGHEVSELQVTPEGSAPGDLSGFDVFHALHAFKTGAPIRLAARRLGAPYVVSVTGTDVHEDLRLPEHGHVVLSVLRDARAILANSLEAEALVRKHGVSTPWVLVPKGVEGEIEDPAPAEPPLSPEGKDPIIFLHVAGWREVKNNIFPLEPLSRLARETPGIRLRFAGPVLDRRYHEAWLEAAGRFPFAEDLGAVEAGLMSRLYRSAAVVLNTSHSEGGSNAVLEAMAAGRTVLASGVPGNQALLSFDEGRWESSTGVLYRSAALPGEGPVRRLHDADDFYSKARRLALEPDLRSKIGQNARQAILRSHSPRQELEKVLEAYRLAGLDP
jgi:glycosyltransferase involved in cell wall biosynthesis